MGTRKIPRGFDRLGLFHGQRDLVFLVVVGIAQVKLRSACAVDPLAEKLIDVGVSRLFDGFD